MPKMMNIQEFMAQFPDDDACLEHLFRTRFGDAPACPKCGEVGKFRKLTKLPAYTCNCGHHIHPMVGTPFHKSRTPLQKWYYAMFIFTTTRNGVAAKEIQRQLGVTYKCAWRIGHKLREYMALADGDMKLGGPGRGGVEVDKAFIGGKDRAGLGDKAIVLGMSERNGDVLTRVIPSRRAKHVIPQVKQWVHTGSRLYTDEAAVYGLLPGQGYRVESINHSAKEWARGDAHTNTIEAFWASLKRGINGTHIWVSKKHLQKYLCEFEFRHNLRKSPHLMFPIHLQAFPRP
ncbi:MAG: IS1595 family transposase [Hyphomicrobiales bacterium]